MKTLVIVDFQRDFANSSGSLYVHGAEIAQQRIIDYINKHHDELSDVVFTIDWHSINHCSFEKNNGGWPIHCVQYSEGAGIVTDLINICICFELPIKIFIKGNKDDQEEYGAFNYIGKCWYDVDKFDIYTANLSDNSYVRFESTNVVVCGLAGDYCVKTTTENLLKCKDLNVSIFEEGIASIDNGRTLNNFISENNLLIETI